MSWDSLADAHQALSRRAAPAWDQYLGFYSSWLGGFFREPWGAGVPLDDHGFHRGDGVFEAVRIFDGAYVDLDAHLARLDRSAGLIGLKPPGDVRAVVLKLGRLSAARHAVLRLYVTRGPGSFSPNPVESSGAQVYAAITTLKPPADAMYAKGCRATVSRVMAKDPFFARIKSLNYLQNVLMKQDCVARGFDLAVCFDDDGRLCEGATENIMLVGPDDVVRAPRFEYTLPGTTLKQILDWAVGVAGIRATELVDLTKDDLLAAREVAFVGTTLGVLPVGRLDDAEIPIGPVCRELQRHWLDRMGTDPSLRTAF